MNAQGELRLYKEMGTDWCPQVIWRAFCLLAEFSTYLFFLRGFVFLRGFGSELDSKRRYFSHFSRTLPNRAQSCISMLSMPSITSRLISACTSCVKPWNRRVYFAVSQGRPQYRSNVPLGPCQRESGNQEAGSRSDIRGV